MTGCGGYCIDSSSFSGTRVTATVNSSGDNWWVFDTNTATNTATIGVAAYGNNIDATSKIELVSVTCTGGSTTPVPATPTPTPVPVVTVKPTTSTAAPVQTTDATQTQPVATTAGNNSNSNSNVTAATNNGGANETQATTRNAASSTYQTNAAGENIIILSDGQTVVVDENGNTIATESSETDVSEETSSNASAVAIGQVGGSDETTETTKPRTVAGRIRRTAATVTSEGSGSKLLLFIILLILCAGVARYMKLRRDGVANEDIIKEFIPLGAVLASAKAVTSKLPGHHSTQVAKKEDEPQVVNGYLKKSDTAPIRPMFSNTPDAQKLRTAPDVVNKPVAPKAPIKRPSNLSVNAAAKAMNNTVATKSVSNTASTIAAASSMAQADVKPIWERTETNAPVWSNGVSANKPVQKTVPQPQEARREVPQQRPVAPWENPAEKAVSPWAKPAQKAVEKPIEPGLKAPVKRPSSASVNRAVSSASAFNAAVIANEQVVSSDEKKTSSKESKNSKNLFGDVKSKIMSIKPEAKQKPAYRNPFEDDPDENVRYVNGRPVPVRKNTSGTAKAE